MKRNSKRTKKLRKLILVCVLSAILLTVSTYAWFIGLQTVTVKPFEINIATTDGLALSLDGLSWSSDLDVTTATQYDGHTNQWLTETDEETGELLSKGLMPVSSVGDVDPTSSRLKLFEKGSLTAKDGGYRLLTSQVENCTYLDEDDEVQVYETEADGYVAFDLFIRNMSGEAYYADNNMLNEEAIYLTYDSDVTVGTSGTKDTGIENSVRVAFAQIGRVENKTYTATDVSKVTGITCTDDDANGVTGICRLAQIWEPNDTDHIDNAISFYNTSCTARTGKTDGFTYDKDTECGEVKDGEAFPTYAISRAIEIEDYVDVYDGAKFNTYTTNTVEPDNETTTPYTDYLTAKAAEGFDEEDYKLVAVDTFTETERGIAADTDTPIGANRNVFMTLAPNSITKVRVYVYIEGQDIDNYDFAQLGKSIQVNFGFTKERYTTDDYEDEPVEIIPGSENVRTVEYDATGAVTEVTGALCDATTETFTTLKLRNEFTFKDGETAKKATFQNGAWAFQNAE